MDDQRTDREGGGSLEVNSTSAVSSKLALIPAVMLFAGAVHQVVKYLEFAERNRQLMLEGRRLPPTMISSPLALAVALSAVGCIFVVVAFRKKATV